MSNLIAAVGTTIAAMNSERQPPRDQARSDTSSEAPEPSVESPAARNLPLAPPSVSHSTVVAGTLLSASLLGQRLRTLEAALHSMRLMRNRTWSPPESEFKLKDKTI